jgi:hypothetical protein
MKIDRVARWMLASAAGLAVAVGLLSGVLYAMEPAEHLLARLAVCATVAFLVGLLWWVSTSARREGRAYSRGLLLLSSLCLLLGVATVGGLTVKQLLETRQTRSAPTVEG